MAKGKKTGGRRAGTPNKATVAAREAVAQFVDGNANRLQEWLDNIAAEKGSQAAFDSFTSLLEYHVPKLQRTEVTGPNGGPQKTEQVIRWGNPID
jgi:hypothetical protein